MKRVLNQEIKKALIRNNQLAADFCDVLGVSMISLPQMLYRNNRRMTQHDSVIFLSERLGITPDEILTDDNSPTVLSDNKISA